MSLGVSSTALAQPPRQLHAGEIAAGHPAPRRGRQRALRRRPPRRREHAPARLARQRRAGARRLPVDHPRRRRAEPHRLRAGAAARAHPHAGAARGARASTAPSSSSRARATSATRRAPTRRCASGARTRCWPTSCAVIRRSSPDVIVTRFSARAAETHGHHTASAILARRGLHGRRRSAALHPEQLAGGRSRGRPPARLEQRLHLEPEAGRGHVGATRSSTSAASTRSSARRTARWPPTAAAMHKSQGFGVAPQRGPRRVLQSARPATRREGRSFDGLDLDLGARASGTEKVGAARRAALERRSTARAAAPEHPGARCASHEAMLGACRRTTRGRRRSSASSSALDRRAARGCSLDATRGRGHGRARAARSR